MALLSNNASLQLSAPSNGNGNGTNSNDGDHMFFSNLLNSFPCWSDTVKGTTTGPVTVPSRDNNVDDFNFANVLGAIGTTPHITPPPIGHDHFGHSIASVGNGNLILSTSPQTSSSGSSLHCISSLGGVVCGRCDVHAISRCFDCNDALCDECVQAHRRNSITREHYLVAISTLSPIGSINSLSNGSPNTDPMCETHGEILRYMCETCRKIVCQECTLWEHKDHTCVPVTGVVDGAKEKIQAILESGKLGTKYIKASIDRAVNFSQSVERDAVEASGRIRKAMRHFVLAAEERERSMLDRVEKFRQQKLTSLSDQMAGLRAALSGLAQTSDMLTKSLDTINQMNPMEVAQILTRGETQMEQFAMMYKNLQPKEEFITFVTPNFELLQDIRNQGDILLTNQRHGIAPICNNTVISSNGNILTRRPIVRNAITPNPTNGQRASWDNQSNILTKSVLSTSPNSLGPIGSALLSSSTSLLGNIGQCIPGSQHHVSAKPALGPSTSFAFDGHEDGQVSRPWGLCVDKDGNIIVADRRNNRIQVFYPDGSFKLKFGSKGANNGQFDLPAGISTDPQNRIVVVDKDNHRVQVFSSNGNYLLKYGSYGKECGQFQYPWDVAVNTKSEMLITDSRNHRIQLFNPDGHFISRFGFDGVNHSRSLKGLTTPRGVCFTPQGDIIISDFENHRLLLVDSSLTKVLSTKGHEGSGIHEFSRPSGICCDDDGRVIVADSKNQRVLIFSQKLEFLWAVEIRPSTNPLLPSNLDEKDRPSDVSLLPDGRLVVMVETSPDARDICNPQKTFVQIY